MVRKVKNGESHYTISMGLANLLANFRYTNIYDAEFVDISEKVDSVIYAEDFLNLDIEKIQGLKILKEKIPVDMSINREVLSYKDVVMELNGRTIYGKFKNCYKIGNSTISLL